MNTRVPALMFSLTTFLPASTSRAQYAWADFSMTWLEVQAGTNMPVPQPNGVLEPGEAARIGLSVSFTPVGTIVYYENPATGYAPVAGFDVVAFNLAASNAQGGGWSHLTIVPGFLGYIDWFEPDGSLTHCSFVQGYPFTGPGGFPISTNPIVAGWQAVWTPSTYEARSAGFQLVQFPLAYPRLIVHTGFHPSGNPSFGWAYADVTFGSISIPIVPGPGAGAILVLGIAAARRRRKM